MDFKIPEREQNSNKGTFGKVLNIAGSKNYIGAAYLSSKAALKIGAGYVSLASSKDVNTTVSKMLPEAVYTTRKTALKNIGKYNAVLVGCGLGMGFKAKSDLKKTLKLSAEFNIPTVIDADGLNILAHLYLKKDCNILRFTQKKDKQIILTPHPAEAARLLGVEVNEVLSDLETSAKKITEKYGCITVLKTHRTIICGRNYELYVNQHGNSALAKAGTGDVLAGIITGLLAQGMPLFEAAKTGVYLHSVAGELASEKLTEFSVLASDLFDYLPEAIRNSIS